MLLSSILVSPDDLTAGSRRQRLEDLRGQRLLHEPDRAVAEQEFASAGVPAPKAIGSCPRVIWGVPAGDVPTDDVG